MAKRKNYTKKADRIAQYMEQINKLRIASICMNEKLAQEAVNELLVLNRRFERQDNPKCL